LKIWYWVAVASGPVVLGLWFLGALSPQTVEAVYSRSVYPFLMAPWSRLLSSVPIALAPWFALALIAAVVLCFLFWPVGKAAAITGASLSVLVAWFFLGWGMNYQRLSWGQSHGWTVSGGTVHQLETLAEHLTERANALRGAMVERDSASWKSDGVRHAVTAAYSKAGSADPLLAGDWGDPKAFPFSDLMSWLGLSGIFIPFTGEPMVNVGPSDWQLPFTMAHEAAHLRGWAREDEANFLAFWVLRDNPDPMLAYSAWSSALLYVASALEGTELGAEAWKRVAVKLSPEIKADWNRSFAYWDRYKGPVREAAGAINDVYLKSQGQSDGIRSYGRMVDLLLASEKE
jgi:predicted membrane protein